MAYNVLKGNVQGSVDQHADQEIDGVKVFKNTISASVFYDTDAQSPCATLKDVAIKKIKGNVNNGLIICDKEDGARTHHNLTYNSDTQTLETKNLKANTVMGSGIFLHDIPTDKFINKINANFLEHGPGLHNVRGTLQVKTSNGIGIEDEAISMQISNNCGLTFKDGSLSVDISKAEKINSAGQNISDNDLLLLTDVSSGKTVNTTMRNLFDAYISMNMHHPVGGISEVQLKGKNGFDSSGALTFNTKDLCLNLEGKIQGNIGSFKDKIVCNGSVYNKVRTVSDNSYDIQDDDYTILCDTSDTPVVVNLPPPVNNAGRILNFKKTNRNTYKLNGNEVTLTCKDGSIDIGNQEIIKMNYSSRTLQCDGQNWWIIGTKGS